MFYKIKVLQQNLRKVLPAHNELRQSICIQKFEFLPIIIQKCHSNMLDNCGFCNIYLHSNIFCDIHQNYFPSIFQLIPICQLFSVAILMRGIRLGMIQQRIEMVTN
ncbi:hypothetical protein DERF_005031 [Dermatophagoides farinae]|uniref:Uncharacterized protein n=1 Tax=Dermatophagoides farinae TaxID=6954 RepID=A0A922L8A2_DERFA|nr:hypothetical protein DERF_005031 [Dermatophagoides farinae]